jgi:hypothetical protein
MSHRKSTQLSGDAPRITAVPIQLSQQSALLSAEPVVTRSTPKGRNKVRNLHQRPRKDVAPWRNLRSIEQLRARVAATAQLITRQADNLIRHFGRDVLSASEVLRFLVKEGFRDPGCASGIGVALGMGELKLPYTVANGVRYWDIAAIRIDRAEWPKPCSSLCPELAPAPCKGRPHP